MPTVNLRNRVWFIGLDGIYDSEGNFVTWQELDSCEALEVIEATSLME